MRNPNVSLRLKSYGPSTSEMPPAPTPRTEILGAHQMDLKVNAGGRLSQKAWYSDVRIYVLAALPLLLINTVPMKMSVFAFNSSYILLSTALISILSIVLVALKARNHPFVRFAWNCFVKPFLTKKPTGIDSDDHQQRLEMFYEGQADIYDVSRRKLLRGRSTMLKLWYIIPLLKCCSAASVLSLHIYQ